MTKKPRVETFHVAVYKTVVRVSSGGDQPLGVFAESDGVFREDADGFGHLWFRHRDPSPGVVAHECLHAAFWVLQFRVGTDPLPPGPTGTREEYLCYLLEFLVGETTAALSRLRRGRRKKRQ